MNLFELKFFVSILDYSPFLFFFSNIERKKEKMNHAKNLAEKNISNVKGRR